MAIYHLSVKTISRSQGRSATAAAAYRAGEKIVDERTGEIHDYTRKSGILYSELILPNGKSTNRSEFWNNIEKHHKRGDAVLVREVEIALPTELTQEQRKNLALSFAKELAERYGVAADIALHSPHQLTSRDLKNNPEQYHEIDPETGRKHNGNWHAHIMLSACHVAHDGTLGKKAVELDPIHCQRAKIENMADRERVRWTELSNAALEKAGHDARIDHRTLKAQGIEREPSKHLGVEATNYERRTGEKSTKRLDFEQEAADRLKTAIEIKELEQDMRQLEHAINALSDDWQQAKIEAAQLQRIKALEVEKAQAEERANKEQQANKLIEDFALQARNKWRAVEADKYLKEAEQLRADALTQQANEPKKPLMVGRKEWEENHNEILSTVSFANRKAADLEGWARRTLNGQTVAEEYCHNQFTYEGMERLKKEQPDLYQVWREVRQERQQEQEQQKQARKRQQGLDKGFER